MIKTSREILFANLLVATNDKIIQYFRINLIYIYNSEFGDLGAHRLVIYERTRGDHRMTDISPARTNRKQQTSMQPKPGTKSYSIQVRHTPIPKYHENEPEHRCNGNSSGVRLVKAKSAMSLFEKKHRHEIGNLLSLCNIIGILYHDD